MKEPIFARQLSDEERKTLKAGLRSPDAFVLRRCQLLLTSATTNKSAYQIARDLGCNSQTVRNVIHKFNEEGLEATLKKGSRRPHTTPHKAFDDRECERLRELLHREAPATLVRTRACGLWSWPPRSALRRALPRGALVGRPSEPRFRAWG